MTEKEGGKASAEQVQIIFGSGWMRSYLSLETLDRMIIELLCTCFFNKHNKEGDHRTKSYYTLIHNMILMSAKNNDFGWRGILIFLFSICIITGWHSFNIWSLRSMISFRQGVCHRTCLATKSQERPLNTVNYSTKRWSSMKWMAQFRVNNSFIQIHSEQNTTGINAF